MRLVDEKGRIFGIVNLIDLFVILMAGILVTSFILNMPLCVKKSEAPCAALPETEVIAKVYFYDVLNEVINNPKVLKKGDVVLMGKGIILDVSRTFNPENKINSNIIVTVKVACTKVRGEYYCNNVPIKINSGVELSNDEYIFNKGVIVDAEPAAKETDNR